MIYIRVFKITLLLFISLSPLKAQSLTGLHPELQWRYARQAYAKTGMHTVMQAWNITDVIDSAEFYPDNFHYYIHPLVETRFSAGRDFPQKYEAGVHTGIALGKTFALDLNYSLSYSRLERPDRKRADSTGLIPHYDRYWTRRGDFYLYPSFNFSLSWTPVQYLTIRAGKDRHFWGDGYRSLFLSDNAYSYPFLQTVLQVWNIKYIFMTTRMSDYELEENFSARRKKYSSMHALSWNITPDINLNLFEVVVWDAVDSVSRRTFDINYIDPVIFLRPVEFSVGSPDNVMIGMGVKLRVWRENYLYGQFVLDEFKLNEIVARTGWWANKYAFQAGMRGFWGRRRPFMYQVEFNQIRPFTYSHYYPLQNYGHLTDCLAHPSGSNLREGLVIARWAFAPEWSAHFTAGYSIQGIDSAGVNYGGNIYKSNTSHGANYGHWILQGIRSVVSRQEIKVARMLVPKWNLQAEAVLSNRFCKREGQTENEFYFSIGLRTLLYRD
jgi:hypothetical protein